MLKQHFDGLPKREDFDLVEEDMPALKDGDIMYRSVRKCGSIPAPYMARTPVPRTMMGEQCRSRG